MWHKETGISYGRVFGKNAYDHLI